MMDRQRRHFLATLGALPFALLAEAPDGRAAEAPPADHDGAGLLLEAVASGDPTRPPLRFGETSPGPILRVRRGAETRVILRNRLAGPTSLDLHGVQVPPPLGGSGPLGGSVAAGAAAEIAFVPPDAGTFWFHPWVLDRRVDETARGLAGILLVEEDNPPEVDADRVLTLSDRDAVVAGPGRLPDRLRIDGGAWPQSETRRPGSRMRLRVVNASTRLAVAVACRGAAPYVVAIDGQPS